MTTYVAKPSLFNNNGMKEFDTALAAVEYLNEKLSDVGVPTHLDYVYIQPSTSKRNLKNTIQEYMDIGKLFVKE
jgi:hypothetical protein